MAISPAPVVRLVALAAMLVWLPSCASQNLPFAHKSGNFQDEVKPFPDVSGVVLTGVAGAPRQSAEALMKAMQMALAVRQVPAGTGTGNKSSFFLQGVAAARAAASGTVNVTVEWGLFRSDGVLVLSRTENARLSHDDWISGAAITPLVDPSASAIAAELQGGPLIDASVPVVTVAAVTGEPRGSPRSLQKSMTASLKKRGLKVRAAGAKMAQDTLRLSGAVFIGAQRGKYRQVRITWVLRNSRGQELGRLNQQNPVPPAQLGSGWKSLSDRIAENAAGGLVKLINELPADALS